MTQILITTPPGFARFSQTTAQHAISLRQRITTTGSQGAAFVTADPKAHRLGSGGGTVNVLFEAWRAANRSKNGKRGKRLSLREWLGGEAKLVLHAGGESRRLPAYAAIGKAFMPLPADVGLHPALPDPMLADYQLAGFENTLRTAGKKAAVLVGSGDVWLDFDPSTLPAATTDITGIGMRVSPEVAQHFGVYFVAKSFEGPGVTSAREIAFFRQKPSPSEVRHFANEYDFFVDTGIWLLSVEATEFLFRRCGWSEEEGCFLTPTKLPAPLDLYTEIGNALGRETKAPRALRAHGFGALSAGVIPLESARFYHLGSSRQLLDSLEEMQRHVTTPQRVYCVASDPAQFVVADRAPAWIEGSESAGTIRLDGHNLLTGLPAGAGVRHLGAGWCLDVAPVGGGKFVVRPYHIDDSSRGVPGAGGKICGIDAAVWLAARGLPVEKEDVFALPLYPVVGAGEISQALVDGFFLDQPGRELSRWLQERRRLCAREIPEAIDYESYFTQRDRGYAAQFEAGFRRLIEQSDTAVLEQDCMALAAFCREKAPELATWLLSRQAVIEKAIVAPELQARFLLLLAEVSGGEARAGFAAAGFSRLQAAMVNSRHLAKVRPQRSLKEDQIVWGRSPVRLDLAGGWTDTPPFCLEAGGTVLNVAVLLNGQPPIQVFVRPTVESTIQLRSIDLGSAETVTTYEELADFRNPRGHFSLPKAALALAGFLPEFIAGRAHRTLKAQLDAIGGGLEVSLLSAVPKGSGLGTSSILAATILGALNRACGAGWDELDVYNRVLGVEQLLTTGGGWQDQAGALFPGLKLIETQRGPSQVPAVRYLPTQLFGADTINRQLLLYYTGATRMAKGILQEIVRDMFLGKADTVRTLEAIRANARRLFHDMHGGDPGAVVRGIAQSWTLNKQLDAGTTTPEIERIIATCGADLAACKLLGAGGGGYMLICARDAAAGLRMRERLEKAPPNPRARFIDFAVSPTGLQVTVS